MFLGVTSIVLILAGTSNLFGDLAFILLCLTVILLVAKAMKKF